MVSNKQEFYSNELKVRLRLLSNFLYPYELLIKHSGTKEVAEQFRWRVNRDEPRTSGQHDFRDLQADFNLGDLYSLQPESPLVEILACLKIFNLMLRSKPLEMMTFLDCGVLEDAVSLLRKMAGLLNLVLGENPQACFNRQFLDRDRLLKSYLLVLQPLLALFH